MKLQNPSYKNHKLQTQWGAVQCDENGVVDVKPEQKAFFTDILKFKDPKAAPKNAAPLTDDEDETEDEDDEETVEDSDEEDDDEDEDEPVDKSKTSRFSNRVKGK